MLEIKNITKVYETGDLRQVALNKVSVNFRKSEFASILGPSGSGKTTLLNIIGGLDKYDSGDLIINGVSTKEYKDASWDSYRNHRIGFVFQSYNLISHQTVLRNVSLALTLSGISKKEGIERAKDALKQVGLEEHMYKRPNQLSGGQMQRVAIARALVNNPDILLADEPTGALDSATSIQIMEILKEVSKKKLVIMVTHNPDLATEYSNRIIELKDGKITGDTNPYDGKDKEKDKLSKNGKTGMSYFTALGLSFNNLMTKKGRTILTSLAGSIGIIGIALILSLSTGFQNYIDQIQEDTMSSYPLTITSETADMSSLLVSMVSNEETDEVKDSDKLVEKQFVSDMFSSVSTNDLRSFKSYLEKNKSKFSSDLTSIKYSYSIDPIIYTKNYDNETTQVNPNQLFSSMYSSIGISSLFSSYSSIFYQMVDDRDSLEEQYEVVAGSWPTNYNEMIVVLSQEHMIPDLVLYFLGYRDMEELTDIVSKSMQGESVEINNTPMELSYDEILNKEFKLIIPADTYKYNKKYDIYEDMSDDEEYMEKVYDKSESLRISGIVIAKEGVSSSTLQAGIAYTSDLVKYIIDESSNKEIVKKQIKNEDVDVFSGNKFDEKEEKSNLDFEDLISIDKKKLTSAFNMKISESEISQMTSGYMEEISSSITTDTTPAYNKFSGSLNTLSKNMFKKLVSNPLHEEESNIKETIESITNETVTNDTIEDLSTSMNITTPDYNITITSETPKVSVVCMSDVENYVNKLLGSSDAKDMFSELESEYVIPSETYKTMFSPLLTSLLSSYIVGYSSIDNSYSKENDACAVVYSNSIDETVSTFMSNAQITVLSNTMASKMTEAKMQKTILTKVGELVQELVTKIASGFSVDADKIASAFKFDLTEEELTRIMSGMMGSDSTSNADTNLLTLGYQDVDEPTMISLYFKDFDAKERVLSAIDEYNDSMEKLGENDKVINYSDTAGILMSSVKKIVNSVSYALIAFVSISLVVSSIMIGIITYISVLERTKEIGILRAIGASKRNISSIFNAETFIIGLLSGLFGIGISLGIVPIFNIVIHKLTDNYNLNAVIPFNACIALIVLSVILTIIGGLIPSKKASKQDPVVALRTE